MSDHWSWHDGANWYAYCLQYFPSYQLIYQQHIVDDLEWFEWKNLNCPSRTFGMTPTCATRMFAWQKIFVQSRHSIDQTYACLNDVFSALSNIWWAHKINFFSFSPKFMRFSACNDYPPITQLAQTLIVVNLCRATDKTKTIFQNRRWDIE